MCGFAQRMIVRLSRRGWTTNLVVAAVSLLIGPAVGVAMKSPKSTIAAKARLLKLHVYLRFGRSVLPLVAYCLPILGQWSVNALIRQVCAIHGFISLNQRRAANPDYYRLLPSLPALQTIRFRCLSSAPAHHRCTLDHHIPDDFPAGQFFGGQVTTSARRKVNARWLFLSGRPKPFDFDTVVARSGEES